MIDNYSKYSKEIMERYKRGEGHFAVVDGKLVTCNNQCDVCLFGKMQGTCGECIAQWLKEKYVPQIELTDFERELLKMLHQNEWRYVARDKDGALYAYKKKPENLDGFYKVEGLENWTCLTKTFGKDILSFIEYAAGVFEIEELINKANDSTSATSASKARKMPDLASAQHSALKILL